MKKPAHGRVWDVFESGGQYLNRTWDCRRMCFSRVMQAQFNHLVIPYTRFRFAIKNNISALYLFVIKIMLTGAGMDWRLYVTQRAIIDRFPFGNTLRRVKRRFFGYKPSPSNIRSTLLHLDMMEREVEATGRSFKGATVLEIGTGWFPTIPIMLAVRGAKQVLMSDMNPHLDEVSFQEVLALLKADKPLDFALQRVKRLSDLPLTYFAPFDIRTIPDGSVDFIISRTVLEHIPGEVLGKLLVEWRPKLKPGGLMVHIIDNSDHLEHRDKSIPKINFLTWSERKHAFVNALTREGENRLRHHEYARIFTNAGYSIVKESAYVHEKTRALVSKLKFNDRYSSMTADQLAALESLYVLEPAQ